MGIMASIPAKSVLGFLLGVLASGQTFATSMDLAAEQVYGERPETVDLQANWQWQPIEGSFCRDGTQAGFFVQENSESTDLMVYLEGGGACFNNQTCGANPSTIDPRKLPVSVGILNSSEERNPVRSWNKVYVPYCTGDVMAGNRENVNVSSSYRNQKFVGFRNMGLFLQDLTDRFAAVDQVLLTGESAGGFGAIYNFDQVQTAFGGTPVYLLNDSGISFSDDYLPPCLQRLWRELWNLNETLPSDCIDCRKPNGGGLINLMDLLALKYGGRQFGFLSSTSDLIIRVFYGYGINNCRAIIPLMSASNFRSGLFDVRENYMNDDFVSFFTNGTDHTFLTNDRFFKTRSGGLRVYEWVDQFITQRASSVGP